MRTTFRFLLVGVVALVIGAGLFFPAATAYRWFAPASVTLGGVSGSVWHGRAAEAMVNGIYLRDLEWHAAPLPLVTGRLRLDVSARPVSGRVVGTVTTSASGLLEVTGLHGTLPLQNIAQAVHMPGLDGIADFRFERLAIRDGLPVAADGTLDIVDLVAPPIDRNPLGGFRAEFFTRDSDIVASVEDTDGVIDIAGTLELSPDRSYRFIAQLAAKASTPSTLRQQLQFLGSPDERGQRELRLEGRL